MTKELRTYEDVDGRTVVELVTAIRLGPIGETSTEDAVYEMDKELMPSYEELKADHLDALDFGDACRATAERAYRDAKEGWTT